MMYSAYKLNKQGDNIQPWLTPSPIWNQSVVPCPVLTVASWPEYRFLRSPNIILILKMRICAYVCAKSLQSCRTLCDPIDGSLPGSAVPGILQARTLEWVAISFSNDATLQSISEPIDMCGPHYSLFMFVFMIATTKNVLIGNARPFFFMFLYKRGFSLPSKHGEC